MPRVVNELVQQKATASSSLLDLIQKLEKPRNLADGAGYRGR
jgi:hypothetical protein